MKVLSVVCARAGSKGLRNKCIAKINGKMVAEYSIEYSLSLGDNVKTVVSTDIEELIDYCIKNDITYIKRKPKFCSDESKIDDALADAIEKEGSEYGYCSLVYGNIPVRYPRMYYEAIKFLEKNEDYDAVISMQETGKYNPEWMYEWNEDILPKVKEENYRRQTLLPKMIHDGHTLIFKSREFLERYRGIISYDEARYSIFGNKIKPLINNEVIIDIDTERDLKIATAIINSQSNTK